MSSWFLEARSVDRVRRDSGTPSRPHIDPPAVKATLARLGRHVQHIDLAGVLARGVHVSRSAAPPGARSTRALAQPEARRASGADDQGPWAYRRIDKHLRSADPYEPGSTRSLLNAGAGRRERVRRALVSEQLLRRLRAQLLIGVRRPRHTPRVCDSRISAPGECVAFYFCTGHRAVLEVSARSGSRQRTRIPPSAMKTASVDITLA